MNGVLTQEGEMTPLTRLMMLCCWLCAVSMPAFSQVAYRCTDAAGKISFQQHPCQGAAKSIEIELREGNIVDGNPVGEAGVRAQAVRSQTVRSAIARGRVMNGMTSSEVSQVLGHPTSVNTDFVNGQVSQQLVYRYPDGSSRYVYTNEGGVWAIQNRPAVPPSERRRR